jgi:hypothetical protein
LQPNVMVTMELCVQVLDGVAEMTVMTLSAVKFARLSYLPVSHICKDHPTACMCYPSFG